MNPAMTSTELDQYVRDRQEGVKDAQDAEKWSDKRENIYRRIRDWGGMVARLAFVAGLWLLLLFAIANM